MRWTKGTRPITKAGFSDAMAGKSPQSDDKDYMKGYSDGMTVREFQDELKRKPRR